MGWSVGRSVAQFYLAGITQASVLTNAQGFAAEERLRILDGSPNHLTMSRGHELWTGERVLRIAAWDVPGGVNVRIEAWASAFPWDELSANPRAIFGWFPRRRAWKLVAKFLGRLGVTSPEGLFRHD